MKNYKFKNLKVGLGKNFDIKITQNILNDFIKISGDNNLIHTDTKFAKKYNFKKKIGHGMLLSLFYSKFIGKILPGKYSLIISTDLKFHRPFFTNDKLKFLGKITYLNKLYKIASIYIKVLNKEKKLISTCSANVKLHE
jgi:acyl dehydratase